MKDQHEMDEPDVFDGPPRVTNADMPEPPHPVNWNLLTAHELEQEWLALNRWVDWLRRTYGLTVAVVPPFWTPSGPVSACDILQHGTVPPPPMSWTRYHPRAGKV